MAGYRDRALTPAETAAWLTRLNELDQRVRRLAWASLPPATQAVFNRQDVSSNEFSAMLDTCAVTLRAVDLANPARLALIRARAQVSDEYRTVNQVLGFYPLTALPVYYGISQYQEEVRARFAQPLAALPVQGVLRRYGDLTTPTIFPDLTALPRDALGIFEPTPAQREMLFAVHAPVWEIDVATTADRPGAPYWRADGLPSTDISRPTVYRYLSHTRWQGQPLLQLNYLIWFAARPKVSAFDLLGGPLDGVLWRVTLDRGGRPLVYDSIHACGCYHLLFPTTATRLHPETAQWAEPPLVPQSASPVGDRQRIVIRLSSGNHDLQRVYAAQPGAVVELAGRDYEALYAVPAENGDKRSLFDPEGLVTGSERTEQWLLWPTGVPSPGAMRERGRHAIAFMGRRHFDDADLLNQMFEPTEIKQ